MTPDDSPAAPPSPPTKTRSPRITKWLVWLTVLLASFLLVIGLLLTYWFPSNLVREELESRLSELLQGTVTIQSLSFNTLTGLQIRGLDFRKPDQPPLTFDRLVLDYSLFGLLTGTFTINEVAIEHANISLNLPELSQGPPSEEPISPSPAEPTSLPPFPISIELDTLAIIDSQVQIIVSPDLQVALSNLNLESSGTVSPQEANLRGQLNVDQLALDFQSKHVQLPFEIIFNTQINLATQHFNLEELTLASYPSMRMTLSGTVSNFFTQDDIQLSLTDTQFHLESLLKMVQDFVPPEWSTAKVKGSLSPTFALQGALPDGQFLGTVQAGLQAKKVQVNLPSLALDLGPTSLDIRAQDIRIKHNQPTGGKISTKTTIQDLTFQSYQLQNLQLGLDGDGLMAGPFFRNTEHRRQDYDSSRNHRHLLYPAIRFDSRYHGQSSHS